MSNCYLQYYLKYVVSIIYVSIDSLNLPSFEAMGHIYHRKLCLLSFVVYCIDYKFYLFNFFKCFWSTFVLRPYFWMCLQGSCPLGNHLPSQGSNQHCAKQACKASSLKTVLFPWPLTVKFRL